MKLGCECASEFPLFLFFVSAFRHSASATTMLRARSGRSFKLAFIRYLRLRCGRASIRGSPPRHEAYFAMRQRDRGPVRSAARRQLPRSAD